MRSGFSSGHGDTARTRGSGHGGSVPAPKPTPLAAPVTRVTQTCSQLVSASALTTSIGVSVPAVAPPAELDSDVTFAQDGALTCNWSDNLADDQLQTSNHLVVWVLPDVSTANWTSAVSAISDDGEAKTAIIGGDAYGWCNPAMPTGTVCEMDTRVGTTWLSFEVESLTKTFGTSDLGLTHFATLINPIITAAGAASFVKEPKWANPAAAATPTSCAAALPVPRFNWSPGCPGSNQSGPTSPIRNHSRSSGCGGESW